MIRHGKALFAAALAGVLFGGPLAAQDAQLRSLDGSVTLEGTLLAYDGAYYQIETVYGPLTVAAEGVQCAGPGCPDLTTFVAEARLVGAATVADGLIPELLAGFARSQGQSLQVAVADDGRKIYQLLRPDGTLAAQFFVTAASTAVGFQALLSRDADIALAVRAPSIAERETDIATAPEDPALTRRVRVVALDALAAVTAPDAAVQVLETQQLSRILAGEIVNWLDLGGPDAPIVVHLLDPELGVAQGAVARILGPSDGAEVPNATFHATTASLARAVARDAYALGITTYAHRGATRAMALSGPCGFRQSPDRSTIRSEDYPLTAPIYFYLAPERLPQLVRQFLEFTTTSAAERIVAQAGYVNQSLTRTGFDLQGTRLGNAIAAAGSDVGLADLQAMIAALSGTDRLSATFRFDAGSTDLDAQSAAAASRLASAIERGAFDGRTLLFVGFSDSAGGAAQNQSLSLDRAQTVRSAVLALVAGDPDRVAVETLSFGEAFPMACDDSDWGRSVNRRVEVWVR